MKTLMSILALCCLCFVGCVAKTVTPDLQSAIDSQRQMSAIWAADPVIVAAVKAQNANGPIVGMTNERWEELSPSDATVRALEQNPAGLMLTQKVIESHGRITEAFLCASHGEKAAMSSKTTRYFHNGTKKFDEPMSGVTRVAKPGYDKSSESYSVQIATPVLDHGQPIGVLVVGIAATKDCGAVWPWDWTWTEADAEDD